MHLFDFYPKVVRVGQFQPELFPWREHERNVEHPSIVHFFEQGIRWTQETDAHASHDLCMAHLMSVSVSCYRSLGMGHGLLKGQQRL